MLVYFFKNRLPWDEISKEEGAGELEVKEKKVSVPSALLCEGLPGTSYVR